ncbi:winged helix-turn-helix transcriptional regulator [Allokutzneria albata]|uniref:DNA-binding transcriptional regulator, HxlR family n=1 Tax=Allokutzneria albata TaxID=211114 RepID=A0A1G9ZA64_ALLAB|nr:helix-turn-helix domain-containing protein [Allokutzneria albata]SDN18270.1 DNA-binding transcriptional regulator, HxlR family [Allokutzneria albata]
MTELGAAWTVLADRGDADEETCRKVLQVLSRIGDKWTLLVIGTLRDGTMRFGELHRQVTGISQRMLTLTLRQLERDGLISRTVHPSVPPKVEYTLTELGRTLLGTALQLATWAADHIDEIEANRHDYDAGLTRADG